MGCPDDRLVLDLAGGDLAVRDQADGAQEASEAGEERVSARL